MDEARSSNGARPQRRRWSFAGCVFDEANWTLTVDGRRAQVENKPLELLRQLLLNAGNLVSKDDLLDAIWPDVVVVEASLPTAVRKLRTALGDDERETHIIETVPRIGYRLAASVEVEELAAAAQGSVTIVASPTVNDDPAVVSPAGRRVLFGRRTLLALSGGLAIVIGAIAMTLASSGEAPATKAAPSFSQQQARDAIRRLDVAAVERMIAAGWNPDSLSLAEGNGALHYAVEMCEWNPGHDRNRLLLMVRTLYEGGAQFYRRNQWGDTPYSIAKSPRYCGPDHPVTQSLRATCTERGVLQDRCLASYEIARRNRH